MLSKILGHFFCIFFSCALTVLLAPIFIYIYNYGLSAERPNFSNYYAVYAIILGLYSVFAIVPLSVLYAPVSAFLSSYAFYQKNKLVLFSGPFFVLLAGLAYLSLFIYSNIYALVTDYGWKGKILQTQFYSSQEKTAFSKALCEEVKSQWSPSGDDFESTVKEIQRLGLKIGGLAAVQQYIQRGSITYYFEPEATQSLEKAKSRTLSAFIKHGIGPTFYWLNKDWYEENKSIYGNHLVEIEEPYIRVRFETLFPVLDEYISKGILQKPPVHILRAAEEAHLKFVRSERLDPLSYTYSTGLYIGYYNVNFMLWGSRDKKDGKAFDRVMLDKITCKYPNFGFKESNFGSPPSSKIELPVFPQGIPSCSEYYRWHKCQKTVAWGDCHKLKNAPAPKCSPFDVTFSPTEY